MTDLQKFVELYKGFGIDCTVFEGDGYGNTEKEFLYINLNEGGYSNNDQDTTSVMFDGYGGFYPVQ